MSGVLKHNTQCRICGSTELEEFLSLGETPLANDFVRAEDFKDEQSFPLRAFFCRECHLAQLVDIVDKKRLFSQYVYFYSGMPASPKHFVAYAQDVMTRFVQDPATERIVEIGSNDGLLLRAFQEQGARVVLGVDPATNITHVANTRGIPTINDFFGKDIALTIRNAGGKAKVMIGNNVVAHIDNLHDLMGGITELLDQKGVFIFQAPYLVDMFENLAYDTIYHEHVSFLAIAPLVRLFKQYGMDVFDVQTFNIQGNSIRVFTCRSGEYPISGRVQELLDKEKSLGMDKVESYHALAAKVQASKEELLELLRDLKQKGASIAAYGAPAKGNTLLNYCKIGPDILDFATEELASKIGLYSPGMHVPVKHINEARKNPPDYYLMLAWNYKDQIMEKEAEYVKKGGKFIIPIGGIRIVGA